MPPSAERDSKRRLMSRKKTQRKHQDCLSPVYLNVYDISSINSYTYWLGFGAYHSGVQVHGVEYAFGAHQYRSTGIFECNPKRCEGFRFRKTVLVGWTEMETAGVKRVMEELAKDYRGNAYDLIIRNCNHFCNDACLRLTANPIPRWVNRLARIGLLCSCVVPVALRTAKIHQRRMEERGNNELKKKLSGCSILLNPDQPSVPSECSVDAMKTS